MRKQIVAGYCRVASLKENDGQIEKQKALLKRLAKKHGLIIGYFYVDGGYSGANLERPELKKLLKDCRTGEVGTVLVSDMDRIARYADLVLKVLAKMKRYKVRVIMGKQGEIVN